MEPLLPRRHRYLIHWIERRLEDRFYDLQSKIQKRNCFISIMWLQTLTIYSQFLRQCSLVKSGYAGVTKKQTVNSSQIRVCHIFDIGRVYNRKRVFQQKCCVLTNFLSLPIGYQLQNATFLLKNYCKLGQYQKYDKLGSGQS